MSVENILSEIKKILESSEALNKKQHFDRLDALTFNLKKHRGCVSAAETIEDDVEQLKLLSNEIELRKAIREEIRNIICDGILAEIKHINDVVDEKLIYDSDM